MVSPSSNLTDVLVLVVSDVFRVIEKVEEHM